MRYALLLTRGFMKNKTYKVSSRKVIFSKGPIHLVDCDVRMPDGKVLSRQIIEHPGAVVIVPRYHKNKYVLIRQFRFAARDWLWEFPAGGIEKGENLRKAAERELIEETELRPRKLTKLFSFYPTPGISSEVMHLFLAEKLESENCYEKDEDEDIEVAAFSFSEIEKMIRQGKIADGKTLLSFYYLKLSGK